MIFLPNRGSIPVVTSMSQRGHHMGQLICEHIHALKWENAEHCVLVELKSLYWGFCRYLVARCCFTMRTSTSGASHCSASIVPLSTGVSTTNGRTWSRDRFVTFCLCTMQPYVSVGFCFSFQSSHSSYKSYKSYIFEIVLYCPIFWLLVL